MTSIASPARLGATVPLVTSWSYTDGGCAVLQRKVGGGSWSTIQSASSAAAGRATTAAKPGVKIQFRTVDGGCKGTVKKTAYGPVFVPRVQDNGSAGQSTNFKVVKGTSYYGGSTIQYPGCDGDFRQTYTGYGFAYVHSGGPWDGIFEIYTDGVYLAQNQMTAPTRYYRQIDFSIAAGAGPETHSVLLSGDGNELCDLDAVIVLATR
jgi:hypothetical protein